MDRHTARYVVCLLAACAALGAASDSRAGAFSVVQTLRLGGCGGIIPAARPLEPSASLTRTAALWAAGIPLNAALARSGYPGGHATGVRVAGPDRSMIAVIRRSSCQSIASRQLQDIGVYQRGWNAWVVVASPFDAGHGPRDLTHAVARAAISNSVAPLHRFVPAPPTDDSESSDPGFAPPATPAPPAPVFEPRSRPLSGSRALQLVNEARARGTRCGGRYFPPAPALQLSDVLASVALGHAVDMAENGYFEHRDLRGESPADRVRAVGYKEQLVGENIAYGTRSIDETVQGWLDSPDHCENIMDPRFAEMGLADAAGRTSRRGLYWVQLLAEPGGGTARIQ